MVGVVRLLNRSLDGFDRDSRHAVIDALRGTSDLRKAITRSGLLADADDIDAEALSAAVAGLPPSISATLRAALLSAAERDLPGVVQWKPGADVELQVWESVSDGVGQVGVLLITPRGRDLADRLG